MSDHESRIYYFTSYSNKWDGQIMESVTLNDGTTLSFDGKMKLKLHLFWVFETFRGSEI